MQHPRSSYSPDYTPSRLLRSFSAKYQNHPSHFFHSFHLFRFKTKQKYFINRKWTKNLVKSWWYGKSGNSMPSPIRSAILLQSSVMPSNNASTLAFASRTRLQIKANNNPNAPFRQAPKTFDDKYDLTPQHRKQLNAKATNERKNESSRLMKMKNNLYYGNPDQT